MRASISLGRFIVRAVVAATLAAAVASCSDGGDAGPADSGAPNPAQGCNLPAAAAGDRIVLFGAYEGDAVSTATIAGQDEVTDTARIVVEPGSEPLYVILSSYESTLWRLEGDVSRVSRVVLTGWAAQGITGIDADRVHFGRQAAPAGDGGSTGSSMEGSTGDGLAPATEGCFAPFYETRGSDGVAARGFVERALGRDVDVFGGAYEVGTLSLPSATLAPSIAPPMPIGFDPTVYLEAVWFHPGGLVSIAPAEVVAESPAEAYDVYPDQMGLAQLVGAGALEVVGGEFYIARPIERFPAGLYGAHAVRFVLGRGVPLPAGDPGHSCVISEETGLPIEEIGACPPAP